MTKLRRYLEKVLRDQQRQPFVEWSLARRVWETCGCAALAGAITGLALGISLVLYLATAGLASLAGMPAAAQHRTLRGALLRTTVGGFTWSVAVLTVFLARGNPAVSRVPDPIGWYLVFATAPATLFGWLIWTTAQRLSQAPEHHELRQTRTGRPHLPNAPLPTSAAAALL